MRATAEAPCTVGNFGPGFDVFSLALERRGDLVTLETAARDSVTVTGAGAERVPTDWVRNAACASIDAMRTLTGRAEPLLVTIDKGMPPGSGLGSSASSNAAAVRAFARLFGARVSAADALRAAGAGEAVATGSAHHDDVAAALFGGLTIVGGAGPDAVVRLTPPDLTLAIALPALELPTREMRALIPDALPRAAIVRNLSRVARIAHACHAGDAGMLVRALDDDVSKPYRAPKIPGFADAEKAARAAGAGAVVLCGSGPATMAVFAGRDDARAEEAARAMRDAYERAGAACATFTTRPLPEVTDDAIPLH